MSSQTPETEIPFPNPYPEASRLAKILPVAQIQPGFYGQDWSNLMLVTTNSRRVVDKIGKMENAAFTVFCIEAGGYTPREAIAMHILDGQQARRMLARVPHFKGSGQSALLTPVSLAKALAWEDGSLVGSWTVRLVPDSLAELPAALREPRKQGTSPEVRFCRVGVRLLVGLKVFLLQGLLLSLPLLVFGWQTLVEGLLALLAAALFLSLTWRLLPGNGWLKGLAAGILLGAALVITLTAGLGWDFRAAAFPALGLFVSSLWMGTILSGVK